MTQISSVITQPIFDIKKCDLFLRLLLKKNVDKLFLMIKRLDISETNLFHLLKNECL